MKTIQNDKMNLDFLLDEEWVQLIVEAKNIGMSKEEVLSFLYENCYPHK